MSKSPTDSGDIHHVKSDLPFYVLFGLISGFYIVMILAMLIAESTFTTADEFFSFLGREEVQFSIRLSLLSCAMSTILSLWVAVPIGYLMSRFHFRGKSIIDAVLDIPIVLPPLVIGLCLLILFNTPVALSIESSLQSLAHSIGNNLVPLTGFAVMSVVAVIFYFVFRRRISRRRVRLLVPIAVIAVLMPAMFFHRLFPTLPEWVPKPAGFQVVNVVYCDQRPFHDSRLVYEAEFLFSGTVKDAIEPLRKRLSESTNLRRVMVRRLSLNGSENGDHRILVQLPADIKEDFPNGAQLIYEVVPIKDVDRIKQLQSELKQVEREIKPLQKFLGASARKVAARAELDDARRMLDKIRQDWKTETIKQDLKPVRRRVDTIQLTVIALQGEIDDLESEMKTILAAIEDQQTLDDLRKQKTELEKNAAQLESQIDGLDNAWKTDSVKWKIHLEVQHPKETSQENIAPTLTFPVMYSVPAVILAQFMVACAFAVRTMRVTFDQIHSRYEDVALTLGCNHSQAFWLVILPQARRGLLAAGTLAWARSLGEFGPILIFAGSTRLRTEVLPTTVFLEFSTGNLSGAVAASLIIIAAAMIVLIVARAFGLRRMGF